jgi:hypothetical protein
MWSDGQAKVAVGRGAATTCDLILDPLIGVYFGWLTRSDAEILVGRGRQSMANGVHNG